MFGHYLASLPGHIATTCQRFRYAVVALALLASAWSAHYTVAHIGINTDTADMLSDKLDWRIAHNNFKTAFPFFSDALIVVVDARTPDLAEAAAN